MDGPVRDEKKQTVKLPATMEETQIHIPEWGSQFETL